MICCAECLGRYVKSGSCKVMQNVEERGRGGDAAYGGVKRK